MTGSDEEFEEYLKRRRPIFSRSSEEVFEPPADLDRRVLRQARDAIREEPPMPLYHGPRWGVPVALAATLLLGFSIFLRVGPSSKSFAPAVTVENVSQSLPASAAAPAESPPNNAAAVVGTASARVAAGSRADRAKVADARNSMAAPPPPAVASAKPVPDAPWRNDAKSWLAEIERLRASGDVARAEAEMAEYKRQHRAYATSPDR